LILLAVAAAHAEDIKTTDGQILKDATITGNDALGVTVSHSDGIARVTYDRLPEELRKKYNYDPKQAQAQAEMERRAAIQRAQAAQTFEQQKAAAAANAATSEALDKLAVAVIGKVLSVTPNGVLLTDATIGIPAMKDEVVGRNPLDGSARTVRKPGVDMIDSKEPIFIHGVANLVDGDQYKGYVFPAPNYAYTAASGAARTVRAFSASKQLSKDLLQGSK
jgi:hypothetical protein